MKKKPVGKKPAKKKKMRKPKEQPMNGMNALASMGGGNPRMTRKNMV